MNLIRNLPHLLASLCVLMLVSCLESHEEVWLNADASGAARYKISMPLAPTKLQGGENGIRKKITEYIEATNAFSSYTLQTSIIEDRLYVDLYVTFDNAMDLQKAGSPEAIKNMPSSSTALMGKTDVNFEGLNIAFKRTVDISKAIPVSKFLAKKSIQDFKLTTVFHLPKAPISHNATSTNHNGKTLIWVVPLEKALKAPQQTMFVMPIPIPWKTIAVMAVIVILSILLIYYIYRKNKPQASSKT